MTSYLGLRVFRGPSWTYEPLDFNYLGIVVEDECRNQKILKVQWDNGVRNNYGIGKEEKYDLLIYDSAASGVKHDGFKCTGCNSPIFGVKWGCFQCRTFLCTKCYMNDCDSLHHYYRVDSCDEIGCFVGKRVKELRTNCRGIFEESKVKKRSELYGINKGIVDKFLDTDCTFRSLVSVKMNETNKLKKLKFGYKGKVEVELDPNEPINEYNEYKIYQNHLRIIGRHPIFNYEFSKLFGKDLSTFQFNFFEDLTDFQIDDIVYIDCFDCLSLQKYQYDLGKSNNELEKLIGKQGTIKSIETERVEIYFENINKRLYFNRRILFNNKNKERKLIRISDKNKLSVVLSDWKAKYANVKINDFYWIPDDEIINKISDKIGVVVTNELPGGLVGIQFKLFPHEICMLIPKDAYRSIDESSDNSGTMTAKINLLTSLDLSISVDNENIDKGRSLIFQKKTEEFIKWITDLKSEFSAQECVNIMKLAVESENKEIINCLMKKLCLKRNVIHEIIYFQYSRNIRISKKILEVLLTYFDDLTLPNYDDGENILHLTAKKGYVDEIELILNIKKELINSVNSKTGYSMLHYAVENNNLSVIELLMKNNCDIYIKDTMDGSTALHLAIKHRYYESLICILQFLTEKLDTNIVNEKGNSILHLSADINVDICQNKWTSILKENKSFIKDTIEKLNHLKLTSKSPYLECDYIIQMPFTMISFLILLKGKNAFETWNVTSNVIGKTPISYFTESIEKLELVSHNLKMSFNLFYRQLNTGNNDEFCKFCFINPATVTYKPCEHKIHCEHCSFMPFKCSECEKDIIEKISDRYDDKLITFESWNELAKSVKNENYPQSLSDWYGFVSKTIKYLECKICFTRNWDLVFECGHQSCRECFDEYNKCGQCNKKDPKYFIIKGN